MLAAGRHIRRRLRSAIVDTSWIAHLEQMSHHFGDIPQHFLRHVVSRFSPEVIQELLQLSSIRLYEIALLEAPEVTRMAVQALINNTASITASHPYSFSNLHNMMQLVSVTSPGQANAQVRETRSLFEHILPFLAEAPGLRHLYITHMLPKTPIPDNDNLEEVPSWTLRFQNHGLHALKPPLLSFELQIGDVPPADVLGVLRGLTGLTRLALTNVIEIENVAEGIVVQDFKPTLPGIPQRIPGHADSFRLHKLKPFRRALGDLLPAGQAPAGTTRASGDGGGGGSGGGGAGEGGGGGGGGGGGQPPGQHSPKDPNLTTQQPSVQPTGPFTRRQIPRLLETPQQIQSHPLLSPQPPQYVSQAQSQVQTQQDAQQQHINAMQQQMQLRQQQQQMPPPPPQRRQRHHSPQLQYQQPPPPRQRQRQQSPHDLQAQQHTHMQQSLQRQQSQQGGLPPLMSQPLEDIPVDTTPSRSPSAEYSPRPISRHGASARRGSLTGSGGASPHSSLPAMARTSSGGRSMSTRGAAASFGTPSALAAGASTSRGTRSGQKRTIEGSRKRALLLSTLDYQVKLSMRTQAYMHSVLVASI